MPYYYYYKLLFSHKIGIWNVFEKNDYKKNNFYVLSFLNVYFIDVKGKQIILRLQIYIYLYHIYNNVSFEHFL